MALNKFGVENQALVINGRDIKDFGETDPPFTHAPIDPKTVVRRGLGGKAVRLDRINPGEEVNLYLNPGSPDSAYMQTLMLSEANITLGHTVIGSLEVALGDEGAIVNTGNTGRAGQSITDDHYILHFNKWNQMKGGE